MSSTSATFVDPQDHEVVIHPIHNQCEKTLASLHDRVQELEKQLPVIARVQYDVGSLQGQMKEHRQLKQRQQAISNRVFLLEQNAQGIRQQMDQVAQHIKITTVAIVSGVVAGIYALVTTQK